MSILYKWRSIEKPTKASWWTEILVASTRETFAHTAQRSNKIELIAEKRGCGAWIVRYRVFQACKSSISIYCSYPTLTSLVLAPRNAHHRILQLPSSPSRR